MTEYTRYVLVAQARTGSTFLNMLLDSHPNIVAYGEIFHATEGVRQSSSRQAPIVQPDEDAVAYVDTHIFRPDVKGVAAVGFKLFYNQARSEWWGTLRPFLKQTSVKFLHLKRRNMLDMYLSLQLGYRSNKWVRYKHEKPSDNEPIQLDAEECLQFMHKFAWRQDREDAYLEGCDVLSLEYQDLVHNLEEESHRIQDFLNIDYHPLFVKTAKQQTRNRVEIIANYGSLRERFVQAVAKGKARPQWLEFFEEQTI